MPLLPPEVLDYIDQKVDSPANVFIELGDYWFFVELRIGEYIVRLSRKENLQKAKFFPPIRGIPLKDHYLKTRLVHLLNK